MAFWKAMWKNPQRAYLIGFAAWFVAMIGVLAVFTGSVTDPSGQAQIALMAAGCFSVWSLMFAVAALATYAKVAGASYEARLQALENELRHNNDA